VLNTFTDFYVLSNNIRSSSSVYLLLLLFQSRGDFVLLYLVSGSATKLQNAALEGYAEDCKLVRLNYQKGKATHFGFVLFL